MFGTDLAGSVIYGEEQFGLRIENIEKDETKIADTCEMLALP